MSSSNNVNIQAAIAANTGRDSYDSISNLIDNNLKKLDADVFTAHDNLSGNDLTAVLNSQKSAVEFKVKDVAASAWQGPKAFSVGGKNLQAANFTQALPELGGGGNGNGVSHNAENLVSDAAKQTFTVPQASNSTQEITHYNGFNRLSENNHQTNTYDGRGSSQRDSVAGRDGRDVMGTDGHNGMGCNGHDGHDGHNGHNGHNGHDGHGGHDANCGCDSCSGHHQDNNHDHEHNHHGHHNHDNGSGHQHPPHEYQLPNLLNLDVLGNVLGGILHGHLGHGGNPLINVIAGSNLLGGLNNGSSAHGSLLDVVTNTNILNPNSGSPLLSNINADVLGGENNTPLIEIGLNGDVLHNGGDVLDLNLLTTKLGEVGPGLGINIADLPNLPKEQLAAIAAQILEKALNDTREVTAEINSIVEELAEDAPNPAQPLVQVGLALATIAATIIEAPAAIAGGVNNVATGLNDMAANLPHLDLNGLANMDLGSTIIAANPFGGLDLNVIDLNGTIGVLSADGSSIIGTVVGDVNNVIGSVNGNVGNIGGALTSDVNSITDAVTGNVEGAASTIVGDVNNVTGSVGSNVNTVTGVLSNEVNHLGSDLGHTVNSVLHDVTAAGTNGLSTGLVNINLGSSQSSGGLVNLDLGSGHSTGLVNIGLSPSSGTISAGIGGADLANVHLGNGSIDISLPVLGSHLGNNSLPEVSIGNSGLGINIGGTLGGLSNSLSHTGLSNLDPLSPFADHGGLAGSGVIHDVADAGHGAVGNILNNVTTITHDTADHHLVVPLLHGHG